MRGTLLLLAFLASFFAFAQNRQAIIANATIPLTKVERIILPELNNKTLQQAELDRRQAQPNTAPQFATAIPLELTPFTHGTWEVLPNGNALWRLRIHSRSAYSLNLGFSQYYMPPGGSLLLYAPNGQEILGPFTPSDNEAHEQLWTPLLDGDEMVLEVQIPVEKKGKLQLQLQTVNHDFMDFSAIVAGACHLDVACSAANGWGIVDKYRDAIQSVAAYGFNGTAFCTGFLINNTQNDCKPYFMTANHCGVTADNAPSVVVFWNYENSTCRDMRPPMGGFLGDGNQDTYNTGAIFRAAYALTDVTLLELDDPLADTAEYFFAGWNLSEDLPKDTVALIHHPGGEEKRASFSFQGVYNGAWGSGNNPVPNGDYLIVPRYDIGASEQGSSGAPLFNKNQQVLGQLRGGTANCNVEGFDAFGWIRRSWTGGGTPATSLRPWLDPANSGILQIQGKPEASCGFVVEVANPTQDICAPAAAVYTLEVSDTFAAPVQLTLNGLPAGTMAVFSQNPAMPGSTVTLTISNTAALAAGKYVLSVTASDGMRATEVVLSLSVSTGTAPSVILQTPVNGADRASLFPNFTWTSTANALYEIQIATDSLFNNIVFTQDSLTELNIGDIHLQATTTYFWRVRAVNTCGQGNWSPAARFTTAAIVCATATPNDVPLEISDLIASTVTSTVNIGLAGAIVDVRVNNLDLTHSWMGDIQVSLATPAGTSVRLFDRPGVPGDQFGCEGEDVEVSFSDSAPNTAEQLENTCNERPAIQGNYRPLDPFALLAGERAAGNWKLTVEDFAPEDGGMLNSWSLEVCASVPKDIGLYADSLQSVCGNQPLVFNLGIGKDFEKSSITLRAVGNPAGSTISFSKNPVAPGDTIQVSVANFVGDTIITIIATDGSDTSSIDIRIRVTGAPDEISLNFPGDNAENIALNTSLEWTAVPEADYYIVTLLKAPNTLIRTDTSTATTIFVNNLTLGTDYRWYVQTVTACGVARSDTFRFKTVPDISLVVSPLTLNACPPDRPSFNIVIGPGFNRPASVSYTVEPQANLPITFSANANDVPVGTTIRANFGSLANVQPGTYKITFQITDGTYTMTDEVNFVFRRTPAVPILQQPLDGASLVEQAPTLNWQRATDATRYRIEIATNDNFSNIVRTVEVTDTFYTVTPQLGGGIFFWRVTSLNDCGFSTSGIFDFTIRAAGVHEWQGQQVTIAPNPTNALLYIRFTNALREDLHVEVFSLNGQLLQRQPFNHANTELSLNLSEYPAGVYLVRLVSGDAALTERIVLQK
ncbi:MAG: T9SS type A sorting domain-containing protein [Saprospiraceae bacterium]